MADVIHLGHKETLTAVLCKIRTKLSIRTEYVYEVFILCNTRSAVRGILRQTLSYGWHHTIGRNNERKRQSVHICGYCSISCRLHT